MVKSGTDEHMASLNEQFSYSAHTQRNAQSQRSSSRLLDRCRRVIRCPETSVRYYNSKRRSIPKSEDPTYAVTETRNHIQSYFLLSYSQESARLAGIDVPTFTFPHSTQESHVLTLWPWKWTLNTSTSFM